ncbi:MAG: GTPase Era [Desulfovibrionaceae bacterium]
MSPQHKFGMVALIGPPNAGKSTLMNAFLGQKLAIVTPKPQTTRNRISGILTKDDAQVVFLDTPGIHRLRGRMNRFLLDSAWNALASCDAVVVMFDAALYASKPYLLDKEAEPMLEPVRGCGLPVLVALNKVDRVKDKAQLLPLMQRLAELFPGCEPLPVSAREEQGLDNLLDKILGHLAEGPAMFPEDQISTVPIRFLASEIIREKLFMSLRQELPYSTAVEIELFDEEGPTVHIAAVIYASRASHKGMIIGKGGQNLKLIGQQAREELEEMLERKVMLELWVKVKEDWTEHPGFLRSIGLGE